MTAQPFRAIASAVLVLACIARLGAQLSFEVATIRPSESLYNGGSMGPKPGRFIAANVPPVTFVTFAHNLKIYQLVGVPSWLR